MVDTTKLTKKDIFNRVIERCKDDEEIVMFMEKELVLLDHKRAAAQRRAAARREKGDELRDVIYEVIVNAEKPLTRDMIFDAIEDDSGTLTVGKVTTRLSQLVALGRIVKEPINAGDGKTKMGYHL